MTYAIYVHRYEYGGVDVNQWLLSFEPEAVDGRGLADFTPDEDKALHFESKADALEFVQTVPVSRPLREDGLPNRPLRAFTLEIRGWA